MMKPIKQESFEEENKLDRTWSYRQSHTSGVNEMNIQIGTPRTRYEHW